MNRKLGVLVVIAVAAVALFTLSAFATDAQMYFSSDKNGQNRVTNIQEGDEIWIVVIDNDQNIDCDIRDKMSPDLKIMDPKTGAYIVWDAYAGGPDPITDYDYLEETGADTGVFVSARAFQVGRREDYDDPAKGTHIVDLPDENGNLDDFQWGGYLYLDDDPGPFADGRAFLFAGAGWNDGILLPGDLADLPSNWDNPDSRDYVIGRFENMDTLIGMYQDPNDPKDVAMGMMKIIDTEATISWDQQIYKDANGSASITVVDPDENLNCNEVEWVPVTILVNPGSWNLDGNSGVYVNSFCGLLQDGGFESTGSPASPAFALWADGAIRWYNIYETRYINYPIAGDGNVVAFSTTDPNGYVKVTFYAQETGVSTGVFQLNINQLLLDLEFDDLYVRDVLVAYYLDPNDFDDFKYATAYIEERQHSITSFTDANRADKDLFWIGRDPVYVQVIDSNANVDSCCPEQVLVHVCDPHGEDDSEWLILDETSSNSPVFFTFAGTQLWPVWDALGVGVFGSNGGFQLQVDNWKIEAFNEDDIYARYNDVYYATDETGLGGLGDIVSNSTADTAFPPAISRIRVQNDVSFDLMSIADTQVYDGSATNMWFLDRQGNRVSGYVNSDCVFIEVLDPDQDEDQYRRERIDAFWDGGQNIPFGPVADALWSCELDSGSHPFNDLLGYVSIFSENDTPKVYVLNPRSGYWASVDLLETGVATGDFVSVICIDLMSVYECVPQLGIIPGDTILAFYQDPSNHSDNAMISIKVGIGGGGTPPSQQSTTMFVDAAGNEVANYNDADTVYVRVIDPSHAGATLLSSAVEIDGVEYDVSATGSSADTFQTAGLDLQLIAGEQLTATYVDPTDQTDTSADTITIIASVLVVDSFYAGPNPFEGEVTFGFNGAGVASLMTVAIYDLAGGVVFETTQTDVSEITWDGAGLANGAYIYVITATDGTNAFDGNGKVFINR